MNQLKKSLFFVAAAVLLVASNALAVTTYQVTTTPTFVINTGRSEALGNVRTTITNTDPGIATTVQYLFRNIACDNDDATGIDADASMAFPGVVTLANVANTTAGCVVSVTVGAFAAGVVGEFIEITGVRGRVDLSPAGAPATGVNIEASLSATPSNSTLFTVPNQGVVGISAVGLVVTDSNAGTTLLCLPDPTEFPSIEFEEGFNGAFVQHVVSEAGTGLPANSRPPFGASNNTQIHLVINDLPAGITLEWPDELESTDGTSILEKIDDSSNGDEATYEFTTPDQAISDLTLETFEVTFNNVGGINEGDITLDDDAGFGTATIQVQLYPPLDEDDVDSITDDPDDGGDDFDKPRFNDPLSDEEDFITNGPCRTNLLYSFVVGATPSSSGVVTGYNTGISISNTSEDPYDTDPQQGTCTLNGYPQGSGAATTFTTPNIASGDTWASTLSSIPAFQGLIGYIIAVCNFQFAHGFAFITDTGAGTSNNLAQGYLPLVIPDPELNGSAGRAASDAATSPAQSGEGLGE
jgi:hypothetical protein